MSDPASPEVKPATENIPGVEFDATIRVAKEWDGRLLVPKEEWEEAQKQDPFLLKIEDWIAQDRAYIVAQYVELQRLMSPVHALRRKIKQTRKRIDARVRQHKHFAKLLRKRIASEKIKKLRKEIGLE